MPFSILVGDDDRPASVRRELWFDQDIDGRWLVWAGRHSADPRLDGEDDSGAIVVKDPQVVAFIEMLGELIAKPDRFHHEPVFSGADGVTGDRSP